MLLKNLFWNNILKCTLIVPTVLVGIYLDIVSQRIDVDKLEHCVHSGSVYPFE